MGKTTDTSVLSDSDLLEEIRKPDEARELILSGAELNQREKLYRLRLFLGLLAAGLLVFVISLLSGRYNCTVSELLASLGYGLLDRIINLINLPGWWGPFSNPLDVTWGKDIDTVMWTVRMPRILAVILIGGGLSVSGASFQCVFRNPLVSEGILGVSNGASLGAVLAIFFGLGPGLTSLCAFAGGLLAVGLAYSCSKMFRGNPTLVLVLAGTVVGSLLTAGNSIVKYLAPQDTKLPQITFWLMGSFAGISWSKLRLMGPLIIICSLGILGMCWQLNLMALLLSVPGLSAAAVSAGSAKPVHQICCGEQRRTQPFRPPRRPALRSQCAFQSAVRYGS